MKKKTEPYPAPTPKEMLSSCIRCGNLVIEAQFKDKPVLFVKNFTNVIVFDFDPSTGLAIARRRMSFAPHECTDDDIERHVSRKRWHKEHGIVTPGQGYQVGDKFAWLGQINDNKLRTFSSACPKCARNPGEPCRSMVKYKNGEVRDTKHPHDERKYQAFKDQGMKLYWSGRHWVVTDIHSKGHGKWKR